MTFRSFLVACVVMSTMTFAFACGSSFKRDPSPTVDDAGTEDGSAVPNESGADASPAATCDKDAIAKQFGSDPECEPCMASNCCELGTACFPFAKGAPGNDCPTFLSCVGGCVTEDADAATRCYQQCTTDYPAGDRTAFQLGQCKKNSCGMLCE